jgi:hypothetical protein
MDDIYPWYERLSEKVVKDAGLEVKETAKHWKLRTKDAE